MDPSANLREQLELAAHDWTGHEIEDFEKNQELLDKLWADHCRLCELVVSLNEWIVKGGFLPTQWNR